MRKNFWKRTAAVALAAMMAVSVIGCGSKDDTTTTGTTAGTTKAEGTTAATEATTETQLEKDPTGIWNSDLGYTKWEGESVELTLQTSYSGALTADVSWWYDFIKEYTGVTFNRTDATDETISTMLASGDLTDIVGFGKAAQLDSTAASGLLLNLDEYQDKLPNLFNNTILESAIQFSRDNRSAGTGKLYHAPMAIGVNEATCCAPMIRYDIYKQIGSPAMATLEDFVDVLKQMRDAHPTTEDGKPVYVYCGWSDWDTGLWDSFMNLLGYETVGGSSVIWIERDGDNIGTQLEKGSDLYRALKACNDLWRNGYIDPDTPTQGYGTAKPKTDEGQGLFMGVEWMGGKYNDIHPGQTGFAMVNADEFDIGIAAPNAVSGAYSIGIAASVAKDEAKLDAALRFLNFFYTPNYYNVTKNAPEGYLWEWDDEGNQVFTEDGIQKYRNERVGIPGSTGEGQMFVGQNVINAQAYTTYTINPETGEPLYHEYWEEFLKTDTRWDEWREDMGVTTTYDWAAAQGDITVKSTAFGMMSAMPDDIQLVSTALTESWKTYAWAMFTASSEAAFDELWDEAAQDLADLDIQSVLDWCTQEFNTAKALADKYPLKTQ
ncbi:MAG: hypothetical protein J6B85_07825 [Lachnospiraceae bacterium]|nr:hypothetical protein [Lachnospiraceae bacterium]